MAERDYQTGLRNRMKFELSIRQYEKRNDISIGLILFDIDGLKGINDTLGHYEGDKVIKVVSENIEKIFAQAAIKLGEYLKLKTHTIDQITLLTKLHDIGKVGIPDDILKKPGALDEKEWKIMKTHTTIGQRISSVSAELKPISDLILLHHEKWDGSGYPMGLSGDAIPIECRILAVVDAFDAMTNDRPYRKALSFKEAISEIIKCKGSHFDPELVDIFLEILSNK
jgi:HD-GYP domain-containing protein (c-di-GMP phosphodiesterase class II)